jgi:hypothetical protein
MVDVGRVIDNSDRDGTGRIYVYIEGIDKDDSLDKEKLAFPLLPKFFSVKPKIGENVIIIGIPNVNGDMMLRTYIGPIISQYQDMLINTGSQSLAGLGLSNCGLQRNPLLTPGSSGSLGKENEVAIYGREKTDILMGDDSVRIRCGARLDSFDIHGKTFKFNTIDSAFMHMKYYDHALNAKKISWDDNKKKLVKKDVTVGSVATISADEINLVSSSDIPKNPINNPGSEMIGDYEIAEIIENGHPMVYGDKLVEILNYFREAIYNHIHDWGPSMAKDHPTPELIKLDELNFGEMLSTNVRVM